MEFLEETRVVKLRSPIQGVAKACKLLTSFFADINLLKVLRVISSGDGSSDPILGGVSAKWGEYWANYHDSRGAKACRKSEAKEK